MDMDKDKDMDMDMDMDWIVILSPHSDSQKKNPRLD